MLALVFRRWRRSSGPARRALNPLWFAGLATLAALILDDVLGFARLTPTQNNAESAARTVIQLSVPVALLIGLVRLRQSRSAVADLILALDRAPGPAGVRQALASALGDQYADIALAARLVDALPRAAGHLLKERIGDTAQLTDALHRVTRGELVLDPDLVRALVTRRRAADPLQRLSDRERAVLTLMAEGHSNAGIAARLYLSPKSVERNVAVVFDKLGLPPDSDDNRRVLAVIAFLRAPA